MTTSPRWRRSSPGACSTTCRIARSRRASAVGSPIRLSCCWSTAARGSSSVAIRVLEELGLDEEIPAAALAKRFEEVYVPGESDPIRIPRQSEALYLLQRIRDEAHRFAITYHRQLRGNRMTTSWLDGITGLGPTRRKRLVKEFGGINAVRQASLESLEALPWLPNAVARAVYEKAHRPG